MVPSPETACSQVGGLGMGEIMGIGLSHGPFVLYNEDSFTGLVRRRMASESTPAELRDPRNWPEPMQREWADDEGLAAAHRHRAKLVDGFRRLRARPPSAASSWAPRSRASSHRARIGRG
jgi:hypothetical protein